MKIEKLLLITGNPGKAKEFKDLIKIDKLKFTHKSLDLQEIQSMNLEEIGEFKISSALQQLGSHLDVDAVMIDDTGLFCSGLNGLPGPFIKWFLDSIGAEGLFDLVGNNNAQTKAVCLLSLGLLKSGKIIHFMGETEGILVSPKGSGGFGWDKIFKPKGSKKTYGEMLPAEKNKISHRTLAVEKFRSWILGD